MFKYSMSRSVSPPVLRQRRERDEGKILALTGPEMGSSSGGYGLYPNPEEIKGLRSVPKNLTTDACDYEPNFGAASFVRPMISVRIAGVTEMYFSTSLKAVGASRT